MTFTNTATDKGYTIYPLSSLFIYNGITLLHYLLGAAGIIIGYGFSPVVSLLGGLYLVLALGQMYILMPLTVCPHCVYYKLKGSRCISGLNLVSKKVVGEGQIKKFAGRGQGLLCHNNLYLGAKVIPILVMIPALVLNFSVLLLALFVAVVGLLLYRIFVVFPKVACVHCRAKKICPNAQSMGLTPK